jgi:hypothetical protein
LNLDTHAENLGTDVKSKLTVGQMEIKRKKESNAFRKTEI